MDPASLALSVATVLDTAVRVVELLHDVKEGGKQRIRLIAEVSSLWLVLENVKSQLEELSDPSSQISSTYFKILSQTNGPLQQCAELLEALRQKLAPRSGPGRVIQSLKWNFDKDECDRCLLQLHRLQSSISLAYAQTSLTILNNVARDTSATCRTLEVQEQKQLLEWLSPIDFEAQQRQTLKEWCPGTVTWWLKVDEYEMFKRCENPYLWYPSAPGSGKTIFSALVVDDLRALASRAKDVVVLGIYLNSRLASTDEAVLSDLLGSLIKQICLSVLGADEDLAAAFNSATKSNKKLSAEDAICHLNRILAPMSRVFVVIDGIDELQPHRRRVELVQQLKACSTSLSIFTAGRPYQELPKLCTPLAHECDVCESGQAPGYYHCEGHLQGGLESDDQLNALLGSKNSLKQQVVDKVVNESSNRSLIAKLYLNHLTTFERAKDVRNALQDPLGSLDQTYTLALETLNKQRPERIRMAQEAIKWVMLTKEPISAAELEQAVQFSIEDDAFDEDDIVPIHRLLDFTAGFLTQTDYGRIEFIHFTAEEFVSKVVWEWFPEGANETTISCLKFLSRPEFERDWASNGETSLLELWKRYPFHPYAARRWPHYMRYAVEDASSELAIAFLSNGALVSTAGLSLAASKDPNLRTPDPVTRPFSSALHMAAQFNLEHLVLRLIDCQVYTDLDMPNYQGRTALWLASMYGQSAAICKLLDAGASPDIADHAGWTPLLVAINRFHDEVVEVLVTHPTRSANININGSGEGFLSSEVSPLRLAITLNNGWATRILLKCPDLMVNAELNGATALSRCAGNDNTVSAKLLLNHPQCDMNMEVNGISALHTASMSGHAPIVELLISRGANVDAIDNQGSKGGPLFCRQ